MIRKNIVLGLVLSLMIILASSIGVAAKMPDEPSEPTLLASGYQVGIMGSTVGPGGDLFFTEGATGTIYRMDKHNGDVSVFASGLPTAIFPIGGPTDLVFVDEVAYVLVSIVGSDIGGSDVVGIYRVDGPTSFTPIADLGQFALDYPSQSDVFILTGVHYSMEAYQGGLLVSDGHHNRILRVSLDGQVSEMIAFGNIVPTGLEVSGNTVYMAEAGPNPHLPADGKVVSFGPDSDTATELASGAPLMVDVEFGRGRLLYGLAQGDFPEGGGDGAPAMPNTGQLVEVNPDGTFSVISEGLNQPVSMEIIQNNAYIFTFSGEIWLIENIGSAPFGTTD
jgi:sugar lactone lactonase YvrE